MKTNKNKSKFTDKELVETVRECRTRMANYTPEQREKLEKRGRALIKKGRHKENKSKNLKELIAILRKDISELEKIARTLCPDCGYDVF